MENLLLGHPKVRESAVIGCPDPVLGEKVCAVVVPQPGQTVTLALLPVNNPTWADTYMFSVQALPAGPNPVPASLGFATMPIYNFNP